MKSKKYMKTATMIIACFAFIVGSAFAQEEKFTKTSFLNNNIRVYVTGEVRNPKTLEIPANIGLVAAIYAVGGPNEFGAMNRVKVIRDGKITEFDCSSPPNEIFELKSSDIILVPMKSAFGK